MVRTGTQQLHMQVAANKGKLAKRLAPDAFPLDYSTAMRVIRDAAAALSPAPVISCEGANTMDNARCGCCMCLCTAPDQNLGMLLSVTSCGFEPHCDAIGHVSTKTACRLLDMHLAVKHMQGIGIRRHPKPLCNASLCPELHGAHTLYVGICKT